MLSPHGELVADIPIDDRDDIDHVLVYELRIGEADYDAVPFRRINDDSEEADRFRIIDVDLTADQSLCMYIMQETALAGTIDFTPTRSVHGNVV
ncbi:MAG: hypothetical protein SVG88_05745 [Halobacteriales archaeon]|nr:hypothetical protein [Halobacteriales archaeon]